jgi:hypothetical protein
MRCSASSIQFSMRLAEATSVAEIAKRRAALPFGVQAFASSYWKDPSRPPSRSRRAYAAIHGIYHSSNWRRAVKGEYVVIGDGAL